MLYFRSIENVVSALRLQFGFGKGEPFLVVGGGENKDSIGFEGVLRSGSKA